MSIIELPFIGGAYETQSKSVSAQESINVFPEADRTGQAPLSMVALPGSSVFKDIGGPIRGMITADAEGSNELIWLVAGNTLYALNESGTLFPQTGTVLGTPSPVQIIQSPTELLLNASGSIYTATKAGGGVVAHPDVAGTMILAGSTCAYLDGYGLLHKNGSGQFWWTDTGDFTNIGGTSFATAEGAPDDIVSVVVDHREIWLFGDRTTEVWVNVGDANNPFQRIPGGFIERGCAAKYSAAKIDNSVFWLGDDFIVYRADGLQPVRVSNHGIENLINQANFPEDSVAMTYSQYGHSFYQLDLGTSTVVYDISTGYWHTRKSYGSNNWRFQHCTEAFGSVFVGGTQSNILYKLDRGVYDDAGTVMEKIRTVGPLRVTEHSTLAMVRFVFEMGEHSDLDTDKKVFLEISDDGGKTFGNRITGSIGKRGQYRQELEFWGLGGFEDNQRVLRLTMTDDAKYTLVGAVADVV